MRSRAPAGLILAVAVLLAASACRDDSAEVGAAASSTTVGLGVDPWLEVEAGFMAACTADGETATDDYCRCVYVEVVEYYGTPAALAEAERALALDPEALDPNLQPAFAGCADRHLVAP